MSYHAPAYRPALGAAVTDSQFQRVAAYASLAADLAIAVGGLYALYRAIKGRR